jgi:pyruvate/2-oxoglutarate/acetoin dehydrogenase E1 component
MTYFDELCRAMNWLGERKDSFFLGQGVVDAGTFMSKTLEGVPLEKRLEFPVCEQLQMGASIGMAMGGYTCISVFPRHNFLLLGLSEMVNLLDKLPEITKGEYIPKVIIRTAVGTTKPIYPGVQHAGNFTEAFKKLLTTVEVVELHEPSEILSAYQYAYQRNGSTLISEFGDFYSSK